MTLKKDKKPVETDNEQMMKPAGSKGKVLIIVQNLPCPFDRRVWQEATALKAAGYQVSIICPKGRGYDKSYELIDGIFIYRHPHPIDASGPIGFLLEYSNSLFWEFLLSLKILYQRGFDIIHACNPPDLIFFIAAFHKVMFGKKFIFDQHDLNPELYEVKFNKKGFFHKLLLTFERWTFHWADGSLATNSAFKQIAITRGGMRSDKVWVVRSYPDLDRFKQADEQETVRDKNEKFLVGYVGIMGKQDGVDYLVRAMAHIVHDQGRKDVSCTIIGNGPELEPLKALAKELKLEEYVQFTDYLKGSALIENLCAFDIGIIPDPPNACNDLLSMNKVFEYSALGKPIVQFDLKQAKLEASDAALIVDKATPDGLANGIITLLDDEPRRIRMGEFAKANAMKSFQWKNEISALLAAYEDILGKAT